MKIAIKFSDNDFWQTITEFLELVDKGINSHHASTSAEERFTKEKIAKLFNQTAPGIYWLVQNGLSYNLDWDAEDYLKITEADILINEEVDNLLCNESWHNSEVFILDTNIDTGRVYTR